MVMFGKKYYYIAGMTPNGKPFFYGDKNWNNEADARLYAYEKLQALLNMEVISSPYRDINRAQAAYRPKIFQQNNDMDEALQRIKHDPNKVI